MVRTGESIRTAVEALAEPRASLCRVVEKHGVPEPRNSERGTQTLLRTIVGQQVSVAAADRCGPSWKRRSAPRPTPPAARRQRRGAARRRHVAAEGRLHPQPRRAGDLRELDLEKLPEDDEEAIALLTKIKGIGRWSAEIYLLFAEGRADVFPAGDLAVLIEIGRLMGLGEAEREAVARDGRSLAAISGAAAVLAWHSYNSAVL